MLARIRVNVPDRPGMLGVVASCIGAAGADIVKLDVLESELGRALDDVFVEVRDATHLTRVEASLAAIGGAVIVGVQHPTPPLTGHAELELVEHVLAQPERGLQTLVDGAPGALGADWGVLVEYGSDETVSQILAGSPQYPGEHAVRLTSPLRLASVQMTPQGTHEPFAGTALVPLGTGPLALVLVRERGLSFHPSEMWRLGQIGLIVGNVLAPV